jgi:hypothetical protein
VFSATPLQQQLQQRLLQHCFNTTSVALLQHAYATLFSAVTYQQCFYSIVFYNIAFALE